MRCLWLTTAVLALLAPAAAHAHAEHLHRVPGTALLTHGPDPRPAGERRVARARAAQAPCFVERTADDTVNEADRRGRRFHAVYALPADAPSRAAEVAPQLEADAFAASALLEQSRGRAVRFDRGTACGRGRLDITTVRLGLSTAALAEHVARGGGVLGLIAAALDRAGLPTADPLDGATGAARRSNYLVWLDGPSPRGSCGQATIALDRRRSAANLNDEGGKVAAVFRDGPGFCGRSTVLHEIGHTLGAVQPAPGEAWTGHCGDSAEDVMCDLRGGDARTVVDAGSDDYWGALPWWTLDLSSFICPDVRCTPARATARPRSRARVARRA